MSKQFIYVNANGNYEETVNAFEVADFINVSTGAPDAAKPIVTEGDGKISGTFIDSGDVDHDQTLNFDINEHRIINDAGTASTELWSANKINTEIVRLDNLFDIQSEPTGFADRDDTDISFTNGTRQFDITLNSPATSYDIYASNGAGMIEKTTISTTKSIVISDVNGPHFIYFDGNTLFETTSFDLRLILGPWVYVAHVYWNVAETQGFLSDERHGLTMDGETHHYLHTTIGTAYVSGLSAAGYTLDSAVDADVQFGISNGAVRDEDIIVNVTHSASPSEIFEQILADPAEIPILYKEGTSGIWKEDAATTYVFKNTVAGRVNYNEYTGATWQQTEMPDGDFGDVWIFGTNYVGGPIIAIQGQTTYADLNTASTSSAASLAALVSSGLPSQEYKLLYRVIFDTDDTYGNTRKVKIQEVIDFRVSSIGGTSVISGISDHGNLSGLTDPDHPASAITVSTASFNGILSASDVLVQTALDTIDDHLHDDRYYTETELDGGQLDNRYFTETEHINVSTGAPDAGKPIILDAGGKLDASFIDQTDIDHGLITGLGDDDHTQYILVDGTRAYTGDQSMGSNKLTNLADGTAQNDAVNLSQLQAYTNGLQDFRISVIDKDLSTPPGSPTTGDRYIVAAGGTGLWTGLDKKLVEWNGSAWVQDIEGDPDAGTLVYVEDENASYVFNSNVFATGSWVIWNTGIYSASLGVELVGNNFQADLLASGGLKLTGNEIGVEPADFAGNGLQDDGADNLEINFSTAFNDNLPVAAQDLNSVAAGEGSHIIGYEDQNGYTTVNNVNDVLDELYALNAAPGNVYITDGVGVTKGDVLYFSGNKIVSTMPTNANHRAIGIAAATVGPSLPVTVLKDQTPLAGVLTAATFGTRYYWNGSGYQTALPAGSGLYVWAAGYAENATDILIDVDFIKRNA